MNANIEMMLNEELEKTLKAVAEAEAGSEEAKWQLQKLEQLAKQSRENEKNADDYNFRVRELKLKEEQVKEGKKDRIWDIVLKGLGIVLPLGFSGYWMAKSLKFEETGTFTSRASQWVGGVRRLFGGK